jgi:hypothetical protein
MLRIASTTPENPQRSIFAKSGLRTTALVIAAFVVLCCSRSIVLKSAQRSFTGVVTDSSAVLVPDATITATNVATGVVSRGTRLSDADRCSRIVKSRNFTLQSLEKHRIVPPGYERIVALLDSTEYGIWSDQT